MRQKSEFCGSIDDLAARWIKPLRFETRDDWRSAQSQSRTSIRLSQAERARLGKIREQIAAVDRVVQSEDRRLLEAVNPDFPLDVTSELHTRSDRMTLEYRRVLGDLAGTGRAT